MIVKKPPKGMTFPEVEGLPIWDGNQAGAAATVARGDCIISVARERGFLPKSLYGIQAKPMQDARKNGATLLPGDELVVQPREKWEKAATDKQHVFRRALVKWRIAVIVQLGGKPRANAACELAYEQTVLKGLKTDGNGLLQVDVPAHLRRARLTIFPEDQANGVTLPRQELDLFAGALPPMQTRHGARARLANLGRAPGPFEEDPWTGAAIEELLLIDDQDAIDALMKRASGTDDAEDPVVDGRLMEALGEGAVA